MFTSNLRIKINFTQDEFTIARLYWVHKNTRSFSDSFEFGLEFFLQIVDFEVLGSSLLTF